MGQMSHRGVKISAERRFLSGIYRGRRVSSAAWIGSGGFVGGAECVIEPYWKSTGINLSRGKRYVLRDIVRGLIVEEPAAVVPVADHVAPLACVDELPQPAVKQLSFGFVSLDVVNTHPLVKAWE